MGTQDGETNWVDVANDLLRKCDLSLRLRKMTDCNADVFVSLYENILGEKVPDYIAVPCSQEDDVHNVQSVIDSLSLDYLQISLSHITGENIVRGDKESIQNLLEIFDGLLEYLSEEINAESQDSEELKDVLQEDEHSENTEQGSVCATKQTETQLEGVSLSSSGESAVQSSKPSLHSCSADGVESTSELIGLGVSARNFTGKQAPGEHPESEMPSAVALQPPNQSAAPRSHGSSTRSQSHPPAAGGSRRLQEEEEEEEEGAVSAKTQTSEPLTNGAHSPAVCRSPAASEQSSSSQHRSRAAEQQTLQPANGGQRKVLFRTQPDVLFLTLQDEVTASSPSPPDTDEEGDHSCMLREMRHRSRRSSGKSRMTPDGLDEPLSSRKERNKRAERELHHISEKLSHRLEELDEMLRRVLGESGEFREEDQQEPQRTHRQHTGTDGEESPPHAHSLSSSPLGDQRSAHGQLEDAVAEALSLEDDSRMNAVTANRSSRGKRPCRSSQFSEYLDSDAYEEELRRYEARQQAELLEARLDAQKAEREYREAILGVDSEEVRLSPPKAKAQHRTQANTPAMRKPRRPESRRKAPQMTIKENDLLPLLRDELPHLHVSHRALRGMWEQQMQQVDRLHAAASSNSHRRRKVSNQLEEAQRKYDLLLELVRKDQEHSKRLGDFKERIKQQKSAQNRLREQRQQVARGKKYHSDFHVQHRARMMRARTKEERVFRQLFQEGLELQKARLREQRVHAREQWAERQRQHQDQIESMENYYKDQFSLLAEKLAQEREEVQVRKTAQEKALLKMKRELRSRMEREIGELQKIIVQNDEDDYIQDLEVQRLRNRVHMASFQYNTSYLH
ncbi:centrosomal protein of 95 kDa isoform X2 [Oryzias melastigma]|uniref:centrosomal protein of 95 kDa isoform X2 n=1 Tax=Oryzias melastigma TaxID=30732 RepID=UPI000CF7D4FA|nr:centrosomal protein of 95 kDa isoform X2 [Oryzias melastigma]